MNKPFFNQVTILGLGLIGGSLGMAIRKRGIARRVVGVARSSVTLRRAKAKGAIDEGTTRLANALTGSDLVVMATPPATVLPVAQEIAKLTQHRLILTDVASTKGEIVQALERFLPKRISVVGGHPMAGSERSGIQVASDTLFDGAVCLLTPTARTSKDALSKMSSLWRGLGSRVVCVSPRRHDLLVAQVSHLPHMAAVGLLLSASRDSLKVTGRGFSDATRIGLSDPELWFQICMTNRREIAQAVDRFLKTLAQLKGDLASGRKKALLRKLATAQRIRAGL